MSTGYVAQLPPDDAEPEVAEDCQPIVDSFDPNDKLVRPGGVTDQHYTPTAVPLRYTVRFQNTGTASALRVVVVDTLSEHLDMRTFERGAASHAYKLRVSGAGRPVLTFTFNNIALPDSTTDPLGSNGYVQFSIRPREGLPAKTRVENAADIVFDYNDPVRTNTVFNVLYDVPAAAFPPSPLKPGTVIATPVITRFTPASGQAGTSVVISGRHFAPVPAGNAVAFNGIAATVTGATDTTLTVRVPAGEATGKITVVTPDGTAASATDFTLIPTPEPTPEPVPTALAPGVQRGTMQVYPNPAPGRFVVAFAAPMPPVREIAVYNALGACVLRLPVADPSLTHQEIRLPGHGPGMFVVVVTTDGGLVTRKVTLK
ncbi:MAG: IPT/TIG domain-containing protein [Cytophagales bacterium]|nr:IPT/TIG domain-containing protein [Cytophagales bacterium]